MVGRATLTTVPSRQAMPDPSTVAPSTQRAAGVPNRMAGPAGAATPPLDAPAPSFGPIPSVNPVSGVRGRQSEQFGEHGPGPGGTVGGDRAVGHRSSQLLHQGGREGVGVELVV